MSNYPPPGGYNPQPGFPPQSGFQQPGFGAPPAPKSGKKKWLIFAGVGCLGILLVVGLIAGAIGYGWYKLANSEASVTAATFVGNNATVKTTVGEPVECNFLFGNISTDNGNG